MQGIEAAINIVVLVAAAVLFLVTVETRWRRREALAHQHELRSIVHFFDMRQFTKDPGTTAHGLGRTASSPPRLLSPNALARYLDYCSEMLSLTAKDAAISAERAGDPVAIEAVSNIEHLTASLSQNIWQKITILHQSTCSVTPEQAPAGRTSNVPA